MADMKRMAGRRVLVTGGAGEIGHAVARRLADEGAAIALLDIDRDKLDAVADRFAGQDVEITRHVCDVTDAAAVADTVSAIERHAGPIYALFNNAGYQGAFAPVHQYPGEDFARVMQINVTGAFHILQAVSARMVATGGGAIVNTASMAGVSGPPNMPAYAASKSAMIGLTLTAAKDLAPHAIRVNAVSPGFIGPGFMWERQVEQQAAADSPYYARDPATVADQMIASVPMARYGQLEEIAGVVAFLLSDDASYMTGTNLPIAGGGQ
ncbi:SDR family NAD(P)-dependent oxidoreductase [Salinisphaera sp. Q1T1-3]|uniref:SDR family NAD(P)-dependent oxidoreductase n=1 Tax=Salinisphaera sp. Q1T1-3 TaxID=2321229 RepID=UPI000E7148DE|nr:SDR family NAD(P)-dependent oxidoreductase [Salinisphaera sp. Q1T1-3]RJS91489.1 SDR family oxidoreductase [Salinisphaera sp. Q1T1-3]